MKASNTQNSSRGCKINKPKRYKTSKKEENFFKRKKNKITHKKEPIKCYKWGKPGNTSRFCKFKSKINNLDLNEEIKEKLENLVVDSFSSEDYFSDESEYQIDELEESSDFDHPEIKVLPNTQELILEVINKIDNPEIQKDYLQKLKDEFQEKKSEDIQKQTYNLNKIFKKN